MDDEQVMIPRTHTEYHQTTTKKQQRHIKQLKKENFITLDENQMHKFGDQKSREKINKSHLKELKQQKIQKAKEQLKQQRNQLKKEKKLKLKQANTEYLKQTQYSRMSLKELKQKIKETQDQ